MFTLLGLRHLCVVDENSRVRGIITRRDLDYAAGHGAWRRNKMAPAPDPVSPSGKSFPLCGPHNSIRLSTIHLIILSRGIALACRQHESQARQRTNRFLLLRQA